MNKIGILFLLILLGGGRVAAQVHHVVVNLDGSTEVGLIDSMNATTVYLTRESSGRQVSLPLNKVYFVYNDYHRLFYASSSFWDRMELIEQYSGTVITLDGTRHPFERLFFDRNFINPRLYLTTERDSLYSISFFQLHHVELDLSILGESVRRGFRRVGGLFLGWTALEIAGDWRQSLRHEKLVSMASVRGLSSAAWTNGQKLLPRVDLIHVKQTGVRYESFITFLFLSTAGHMAYDYWYGNRNHYFMLHDRRERYPHSMFYFRLDRRLREEIESIRDQISY